MIVGMLLIPTRADGHLEEMNDWRQMAQLAAREEIDFLLMRSDQIHRDDKRIQVLKPIKRHSHDSLPVFAPQKSRWPDVIWDRGRYQSGERFETYRKLRTDLINQHRHHPSAPIWMNGPFVNKWALHRFLEADKQRPFQVPSTLFFDQHMRQKEFDAFIEQHPVCYFKPVNGTGGRGIIRIKRTVDHVQLQGVTALRKAMGYRTKRLRDVREWLLDWTQLPENRIYRRRFILQQGIDTVRPSDQCVHDYRVLVQKDHQGIWQVSGMGMRVGAVGQISSNLHQHGHAEQVPFALNELLHHTSLHIANWLEHHPQIHNQCEFGLDLAVSPAREIFLIEVNPKPGRQLFQLIGDRHAVRLAYQRPLAYARFLHEQRTTETP